MRVDLARKSRTPPKIEIWHPKINFCPDQVRFKNPSLRFNRRSNRSCFNNHHHHGKRVRGLWSVLILSNDLSSEESKKLKSVKKWKRKKTWRRRKRARKRTRLEGLKKLGAVGLKYGSRNEQKAEKEGVVKDKSRVRVLIKENQKEGFLFWWKKRARNQAKGVKSRPRCTISHDQSSVVGENGFPEQQAIIKRGEEYEFIVLYGGRSVRSVHEGFSLDVKGEVGLSRRRKVHGCGFSEKLQIRSVQWIESEKMKYEYYYFKVTPNFYGYKYSTWNVFMIHYHSLFFLYLNLLISRIVYVHYYLDYLGWLRVYICVSLSFPLIAMEKATGKGACASESDYSKNMTSSSTNNLGINTPGFMPSGLNSQVSNPNGSVPRTWEGVKEKSQVESLDVQLERIKLESLEFKRNNSFMGFVCGNSNEFRRVKAKLLSIWRLVRGEVQIYERGHGWFECIFNEPHHLNRVWNNRPYHVMGHLLLLRPWRVDFSTFDEDTNVLDLWIRIFHLPPTLACHDGVKLIVEENELGEFLKFDRASGVPFARVCINIDVAKNVPGDVRISDNNDHPLLLVWFEDFPHGCGNCGELDHIFKSCPLRKYIPKKMSITIIRKEATPSVVPPPSVVDVEEEDEGWILVDNVKKRKSKVGSSSRSSAQLGHFESTIASVEGGSTVAGKGKMGGDVFSSPLSSLKEDSKEVADQLEAMLGVEEGEIVNQKSQAEFIMELENEILSGVPQVTASKELIINKTEVKTKSDSIKRKGEEDGGEDTASSSLKRKKPSGLP